MPLGLINNPTFVGVTKDDQSHTQPLSAQFIINFAQLTPQDITLPSGQILHNAVSIDINVNTIPGAATFKVSKSIQFSLVNNYNTSEGNDWAAGEMYIIIPSSGQVFIINGNSQSLDPGTGAGAFTLNAGSVVACLPLVPFTSGPIRFIKARDSVAGATGFVYCNVNNFHVAPYLYCSRTITPFV